MPFHPYYSSFFPPHPRKQPLRLEGLEERCVLSDLSILELAALPTTNPAILRSPSAGPEGTIDQQAASSAAALRLLHGLHVVDQAGDNPGGIAHPADPLHAGINEVPGDHVQEPLSGWDYHKGEDRMEALLSALDSVFTEDGHLNSSSRASPLSIGIMPAPGELEEHHELVDDKTGVCRNGEFLAFALRAEAGNAEKLPAWPGDRHRAEPLSSPVSLITSAAETQRALASGEITDPNRIPDPFELFPRAGGHEPAVASALELERRDQPADQGELPAGAPQSADLLGDGLPIDLAGLERGLQSFLESLESLGTRLLTNGAGVGLMPWVGTVVTALAALEVARRQAKPEAGEHEGASRWPSLAWNRLLLEDEPPSTEKACLPSTTFCSS